MQHAMGRTTQPHHYDHEDAPHPAPDGSINFAGPYPNAPAHGALGAPLAGTVPGAGQVLTNAELSSIVRQLQAQLAVAQLAIANGSVVAGTQGSAPSHAALWAQATPGGGGGGCGGEGTDNRSYVFCPRFEPPSPPTTMPCVPALGWPRVSRAPEHAPAPASAV